MSKKLLDSQLEETLLKETRETFAVGMRFAPLLYLSFWVADVFYSPEFKWHFLALRLVHGAFVLALYFYLKSPRKLVHYQVAGVIWAAIAANLITAMIFLTDGPTSVYYAGLNLVALLAIFFIPYRAVMQWSAIASIFVPYFVASAFAVRAEQSLHFLLQGCFITGTIMIGTIIRKVQFLTRVREVAAQNALASEVADREQIIREKTEETVKLSKLSNQFSPQVVEAIRSGDVELAVNARRALIAAIFIDIVNSTERVVRVDKDKVNKVISMFLEDTVRILLKYDITIDKFLGDGILGFCNDPARHADFVERTVRAALEIRDKIQSRQDEYENYWLNQLQIRVGIAHGYANVGFYGSEKLYKCYTAIGPVVNLACRLCSVAEPNEILMTHDVYESVPPNHFTSTFKGKKTLKGFEGDLIKVYSLDGYADSHSAIGSSDLPECENCHQGSFYLASNEVGQFVFKCRQCGFVKEAHAIAAVPTNKTAA